MTPRALQVRSHDATGASSQAGGGPQQQQRRQNSQGPRAPRLAGSASLSECRANHHARRGSLEPTDAQLRPDSCHRSRNRTPHRPSVAWRHRPTVTSTSRRAFLTTVAIGPASGVFLLFRSVRPWSGTWGAPRCSPLNPAVHRCLGTWLVHSRGRRDLPSRNLPRSISWNVSSSSAQPNRAGSLRTSVPASRPAIDQEQARS